MKENFTEVNEPISYIKSPLLESRGVKHMFTRKHGGVSTGCYSSLNFATGSGDIADSWENVVANHALVAKELGVNIEDICRSYQTHTSKVKRVDKSFRGVGLTKPAFDEGIDGLVCADSGVVLSVRGADCVTLLFYDTEKKVYGACHSGWRGTAGGISANMVREMCDLGANAENIIVAIGPSAGACCYQVSEEIMTRFLDADKDFSSCFEYREASLFLNLQQAVTQTLVKSGVKPEHISDCGECTVCNGDNYFSHRTSGIMRGTMAAFITA